jgi:molybdenum cofactor synthesis domain-containing protein
MSGSTHIGGESASAGVVIVGDEILSGKFVEENAAYLIGELRGLGVSLRRVCVVADVVADIAEVVGDMSRRYDHVFTSGGVGPTHDDVTMEGIARAFGVRVVRAPQLVAALEKYYGDALLERNLRMAEVPEGAHFVTADHPSWPVTAMHNVYILPGVPMLFRRKFDAIKERFRVRPFVVRKVFCFGDEGALAGALDAVVAAFAGVQLGSYPRFDAQDYRVILTVEGRDAGEVEAATRMLISRLPGGAFVRQE